MAAANAATGRHGGGGRGRIGGGSGSGGGRGSVGRSDAEV